MRPVWHPDTLGRARSLLRGTVKLWNCHEWRRQQPSRSGRPDGLPRGCVRRPLVSGNCPTSTATSPTYAVGTGASSDYACPATNPVTTPYNNNPAYLILPLQSDYRVSDTAGAEQRLGRLQHREMVRRRGGTCSGVGTPGGQGTFYAGAIDEAQAYLTANSVANVQNIIILLSDGDATASSTQMGGSVTHYSATAECQQAVTSATNAKATANPIPPASNLDLLGIVRLGNIGLHHGGHPHPVPDNGQYRLHAHVPVFLFGRTDGRRNHQHDLQRRSVRYDLEPGLHGYRCGPHDLPQDSQRYLRRCFLT